MEHPQLYTLSQVPWQLFATLTFRSDRLSDRSRWSLVFAWLRKAALWQRVHFSKLLWIVRMERGEKGGRLHFHVLLGGLPAERLTERYRLVLCGAWKGQRGCGMAHVVTYRFDLSGVDYVLKSLEFAHSYRDDGKFYEARKFGGRPGLYNPLLTVMCSKSVFSLIRARRGILTLRHHARVSSGGLPFSQVDTSVLSATKG